ncbi:chitinase [Xanthomonas phage Xoo-sp13]|nr:chitinase [Xanthomonas phage Xoo-sp13]
MSILTKELLLKFAPKLPADAADVIVKAISASKVNTPLRIAHFLAQAAHESTLFSKTTENTNYSADGLAITFSKYFPTDAIRNQYARKPEAIANRAYANRNGNGNEASGDGFKYRGRGYFQLTGKGNYASYSQAQYGDNRLVDDPTLAAQPLDAVLSSLWYWDNNNLSKWADKDDVLRVSKVINLGNSEHKATPNGLDDRQKYLKLAKTILNIK